MCFAPATPTKAVLHEKMARSIARELNLGEQDAQTIAYGAFAVVQTGLALFLAASLGFALGIAWQALAVSFSSNILRGFSGGAHASKPSICLFVGTAVTLLLAGLSAWAAVFFPPRAPLWAAPGVLAVSLVSVWRNAPVDSPAKPITDPKKRKKMKTASLRAVTALCAAGAAAGVLFPFGFPASLILSVYAGVLWQSLTLTAAGRKALSCIDAALAASLFLAKENKK
jgi:accessory gene regulator B